MVHLVLVCYHFLKLLHIFLNHLFSRAKNPTLFNLSLHRSYSMLRKSFVPFSAFFFLISN